MEVKTAGIIVIGDEVLKGQVVESNVGFLSKKLHFLGVKLCKVSIIPDVIEDIASEVADFSSKYDRVITTGGIGPTHDDMTYEGIAAAFKEPLHVNKELLEFWSWYNRDVSQDERESTKKMATVPQSSNIIYADLSKDLVPLGRFPVVTIHNVCVFPGIPTYLKALFNSLIGTYFYASGVKFHVLTVYLKVYESVFVDVLNKAVAEYQNRVLFGSYPKVNNPKYKTVITIEANSEEEAKSAQEYLKSQFKREWLVEDEFLIEPWLRIDHLIATDSTGFGNVLKESIEVVEQILNENSAAEIFLAFNGGKDCTALLHLVHSVWTRQGNRPKLTAVYFRPKDPLDSVEQFIDVTAQRYNLNLVREDGPIKSALARLSTTEVGRAWKVAFLGTRRTDPGGMNLTHVQPTDEGWVSLLRASPLLDWSYKDVWTFLRQLDVPYCTLYDKGYTSLGCASNSKPNSRLKYTEDGVVKYKQAYLLEDVSTERDGR